MTPWIPYSPGWRTFPSLSEDLERQLRAVTPSHDGSVAYYPCAAVLRDGTALERVYVLDAQSYISEWGDWPDQDNAKQTVDISQVISLRESPHRLPAEIANRIYCGGESGMGYVVFTITFGDGTRQAYVSGNAVDFVAYPSGKTLSDVKGVILHHGRSDKPLVEHSPYCWCLHGVGGSEREFKKWAG